MFLEFLCYLHKFSLIQVLYCIYFLFQYFFVFAQVYSNLEGNKTHVVNTAWAMLALIEAGQV